MQPWECYSAVLNWIFILLYKKGKEEETGTYRYFWTIKELVFSFVVVSGKCLTGHLPWTHRCAAVPLTTA